MRASAFSLAAVLTALACSPPSVSARAVKADAAAIKASIESPDRPAADKERDAWAKPEAVLTFLGARPGMHVIDYMTGGGYYSELLARVVGPKGNVIAYNNGGYASYAGQDFAKRFAGNRVPNTSLKVKEIAELNLPANSLDAALFVMSYHDVYYTPEGAKGPMGDASQMVRAIFTGLKPGGVVVVQDHVAVVGSDPVDAVNKLHRVDPAVVKSTFEQAGFTLEAEDNTFKNPEDDHTRLVFDPSIRHKTDEFLYRFRKPG
jgi:predicted methyltransferase